MKDLVISYNDTPVTTSLKVAERFGKEHRNVLADIRGLIGQMGGMLKIQHTPMFEETSYIHEQNGQTYPMYYINRDGFTLLAMGFTGKKALKFKLDYINAFNKMELKLKQLLSEGKTQYWFDTRHHGKETRKIAQGVYYNFALYAQAQGDTREIGHIIAAVTIPCNLACGLPKRNGRDSATVHQLNTLDLIEGSVQNVITEGMANGEHFTQIQAKVKVWIERFMAMIFQKQIQ